MSDASITVMQLLDELEEILETASKVPFSDKAIVDSQEVSAIIENIRISMPKDIQQAKWVKDEQARILDEARIEYDKIIAAANKQAEYLVDNNAVKRAAEKRAAALLAEAENHSNYIKLRSYEYIDKMLYDMQMDISKATEAYIQPMNDYFAEMINGFNTKVNGNRQEMNKMAETVHRAAEASTAASYQQSYVEDDE